MKSSDEMLDSLLKRREQYDIERKRKRKTLVRAALSVCCVCIIAATSLIMIFGNRHEPESSEVSESIAMMPFGVSKKDPTGDSFSIDEIHHVDVVLNGVFRYNQLAPEEYELNGIKNSLEAEDFGKYLGKVVETTKDDKTVEIGAQEPSLAGGEVYYYAKTAKAMLIVKKGKQCSLFRFLTGNIKYLYEFHGVESYEDIAYISYCIQGMDGSEYKVTEKGKITDESKIQSFYEVTSSLVPYEVSDGISASPQWLIDAWDEYKKAPDKFNREDISVTVHFKNGTVSDLITYQPYLATGFVQAMELLTPEQNEALRSALTAD